MRHICPALLCLLLLLPPGSLLAQEAELDEKAKELEQLKEKEDRLQKELEAVKKLRERAQEDLRQARAEQMVKAMRARFSALPGREFPAEIIEVGNEASEATRTYPVNLLMEQPEDIKILPGMAGEANATVELPGAPHDSEALEVRLSALVTDDNEASYVWVIDPETQTVSHRDVELGDTTSRGILVRGLTRGEWVAIAGTSTLREGQKVRIVEQGRRG